MPRLILIIGKSVTGKSYIIKNLEYFGDDYEVVVKVVSRSPRNDEIDKNDEFVFCNKIKIIKAMDVNYKWRDEWYGFNKKDIDSIIANGKYPITVVRYIETVEILKKWYPNLVVIYLDDSKISLNAKKEKLRLKGYSDEAIKRRIIEGLEEQLTNEYEYGKSRGLIKESCTIDKLFESCFLDQVKIVLDNNR